MRWTGQRRPISIHAPREGGDLTVEMVPTATGSISIHAPREGGDKQNRLDEKAWEISIHAPREGGDPGL